MNQGMFEVLLSQQKKANRLLEDLIAAVQAAKPLVIAVPAEANAADLMEEIHAALYGQAHPTQSGSGEPPTPPTMKKKSKAKEK